MTPTPDTPADDCPHCGAEENDSLLSNTAKRFDCGSIWCYAGNAFREHSALCKERSARQKAEAEVERLREALNLIAAPKRPDGTYNRCREACEQLAKEALNQTNP